MNTQAAAFWRGARESIGWTSSQEWLAAALNGDDVDA
jgi:hypothetical protein